MPRNPDGSLSGEQCLLGGLDLYNVSGAIRMQLLALIEAERLRQSKNNAAGPK